MSWGTGVLAWGAALAIATPLVAQVPGELRGHLTDARTAQPVANGRVEVVGVGTVRSDADGSYLIRGLEPRTHDVRVRALGYEEHRDEAGIANGRTTILDIALEPVVRSLDAVVVRAADDSLARGAVLFARADIARSGKRDVGELLQTVPGVVITQAGGPGSPSHVSIRGSASNEVLVLIDGVPANSAIDGEVDLSRVSLETTERVTVRTGAQSARYGSRALAGVIEIETRRPTAEASLAGRAGAWGERGSALTLGQRGAIGDRLRGALSVTGDYRTTVGDFAYDVPAVRGGGTARRQNAGLTTKQLLGTAGVEGDAWDLRVRAGASDLTRGIAGSIVQPSLTGRQSQRRASAGVDARGQRGVLGWSALADVTRERATFADTAPPFGSRYDDTVRATGLSASGSTTLDLRGVHLSFGGEARSLDVASTMLAPEAPHWQRTLGLWASARTAHRLTDALQLDADAAGRVDRTSLVAGTTFSPRVSMGVSHAIATLSGSIGAGYNPPSLSDQFFHEGVQVKPNPALRPERTRRDLEARLTVHERAIGFARIGADAAIYRADVDGMILWQPDFRFIWSPSNFDVARSGWELGARAATRDGLFDAQGSLSRSDVTYRGDVLTGQVAYRPRTTSSFTLGVSPGAFRLETTTRYAGERRTVAGSELNVLDPYWRTDAKASWIARVDRWQLETTAGVENLLEQPATLLVDYPFPGRAWSFAVRLRRDIASRAR